mgnify:CR=1 FL=1
MTNIENEFWEGMNKVITDYVDSVTLEQLIEQQKRRVMVHGSCGDCKGC